MNPVKIQLQSVLYKNDKISIERAVCHVANAVRVCKKAGRDISCSLHYGDASPEPLYTKEEVQALWMKYPEIADLSVVYFNENTGTSRGHNKLAKEAECDFLLLMNPDIMLTPNFFEEIFKPFEDPKVGATEGRQIPIEHPKEYDRKTFETDWISGACTCIRTEIFRQIGGYDEASFFMYCDDVDLAWRVKLAGYGLKFCPRAMVYHSKSLSLDGGWEPTDAEVYYSAEAKLIMCHKWSREDLLAENLKHYEQEGSQQEKLAAENFRRKLSEGKLTPPVDPEHKVGKFIDGCYTKHRYVL